MLVISVFQLLSVSLFVENSTYTELGDVELFHCAFQCSQVKSCVSMFYRKFTKQCWLTDTVIDDKASMKTSIGYQQFVKQRADNDENEAESSCETGIVRCPAVHFDENTASGNVAVDSQGVVGYDKRRNVQSRSPSLMKNMVLNSKGFHGPHHVYFVVSIIFDTTGTFTKANWKAMRIILGTHAAFYKSESRNRVWLSNGTCTIEVGHGSRSSIVSVVIYDQGKKTSRKPLTETELAVIVHGRWSFDVGCMLDFTKGHVHIIDTNNASVIHTCMDLPVGEALWAAVYLHGGESHAKFKSGKSIMADPKLESMLKKKLQ